MNTPRIQRHGNLLSVQPTPSEPVAGQDARTDAPTGGARPDRYDGTQGIDTSVTGNVEPPPSGETVKPGSMVWKWVGSELTKAREAWTKIPWTEIRLKGAIHPATEILQFKGWEDALPHLKPGMLVMAPTKVKIHGLPVPTAHFGVVNPNGTITHYHGQVTPPGATQPGGILDEPLELFAKGRTSTGAPADQHRPITLVTLRDVDMRHFESTEAFSTWMKPYADRVMKDPKFNVLGEQNCRHFALHMLLGDDVIERFVWPM